MDMNKPETTHSEQTEVITTALYIVAFVGFMLPGLPGDLTSQMTIAHRCGGHIDPVMATTETGHQMSWMMIRGEIENVSSRFCLMKTTNLIHSTGVSLMVKRRRNDLLMTPKVNICTI